MHDVPIDRSRTRAARLPARAPARPHAHELSTEPGRQITTAERFCFHISAHADGERRGPVPI